MSYQFKSQCAHMAKNPYIYNLKAGLQCYTKNIRLLVNNETANWKKIKNKLITIKYKNKSHYN